MSASRATGQHPTFLYSSFYDLYQKARAQAGTPADLAKGMVLKTLAPEVATDADRETLGSWARNESLDGKKSLANHLQELRTARKKLAFMIAEVDELMKRT